MSFSRQNKDLEARFIEIDEHSEDQRLDNFLLRELKKVPKSYIYRIVRSGEVRVNKGRKRVNYRLQIGDSVRIPPIRDVAEAKPVKAANLDWLLERIILEDEHLLVLDKPSGMAVHGGSGLNFGIIEAMRKLKPELKFLELVHRLDRDTSGVLLLAKKRSALRSLHEQMRGNGFIKHYTALVQGQLENKVEDVSAPLKKITRGGERMVIVDETGKESRSYITRLQSFKPNIGIETGATLVDIRLFTGRTHQARAHATSIGHPIAGDTRYGNKIFNDQMKSFGLTRLFLHATWIQFPHPGTGDQIKIESTLPEELRNVVKNLEK